MPRSATISFPATPLSKDWEHLAQLAAEDYARQQAGAPSADAALAPAAT